MPTSRIERERFLDRLGIGVEDLFHHVLATLHDSAYREANAGGIAHGMAAHSAAGLADGEAEGAAKALARRQRTVAVWQRCSIRNCPCQARSVRTGTPEIAVPSTGRWTLHVGRGLLRYRGLGSLWSVATP